MKKTIYIFLLLLFSSNLYALNILGAKFKYLDLTASLPSATYIDIYDKKIDKNTRITSEFSDLNPNFSLALVGEPNYIVGKSIALGYKFQLLNTTYEHSDKGGIGSSSLKTNSYAFAYQLSYKLGNDSFGIEVGAAAGLGYVTLKGEATLGNNSGELNTGTDGLPVDSKTVDFDVAEFTLVKGYYVQFIMNEWVLLKLDVLSYDFNDGDYKFDQRNINLGLSLRIDI